jgi:putative ABC transport system permease protein
VAIVPDYVSDKGSVILTRDLLASLWNDRLVNYFAVTLQEGATVDALAHEVDEQVAGSDALAVTATSRMVDRVDQLIGKAFSDIDTIMLLVLFLTVVGIMDLVVSNVLSRRRELAVLRLVGLTDHQLLRTVRYEGLCIAVGAALCGAVVGGLCAWVWVHYNYPALVGYVLRLEIAWGSILASLFLAAGSAWIAGTMAARYALRQTALAMIRFE